MFCSQRDGQGLPRHLLDDPTEDLIADIGVLPRAARSELEGMSRGDLDQRFLRHAWKGWQFLVSRVVQSRAVTE